MGIRGIYRLIMLIMSIAIVAFAAIAYVNWLAMREENAEREMVRKKLSDHLENLKAEREYKTQYFYRLLHDEKFAERIIREKLGFVGKDEIVFRFDDSNPVGIEMGAGSMGGKPVSNAASGDDNSAENLAEDFRRGQLYDSEPRESILSRLMFWRHRVSPQSASGGTVDEDDSGEQIPQINIDLLEQTAEKNMAAAKAAQKREEENATVQIKFSLDPYDSEKNEDLGEGETEEKRSFETSDFMSSQRHSGALVPFGSQKTSTIKVGGGSSNSRGEKRPGSVKKIRFQSN